MSDKEDEIIYPSMGMEASRLQQLDINTPSQAVANAVKVLSSLKLTDSDIETYSMLLLGYLRERGDADRLLLMFSVARALNWKWLKYAGFCKLALSCSVKGMGRASVVEIAKPANPMGEQREGAVSRLRNYIGEKLG